MKQQQKGKQAHKSDHPRWLLIALASIGVHQIQSLMIEPEERTFRLSVLTVLSCMPLAWLLPARVRGILWLLGGMPPVLGAIIGHLLPIIRTQEVPPASETAPFNLAGGVLLSALGASLVLAPSASDEVHSQA